MFILKIIVLSSAVLIGLWYVGFSVTQYDIVQFIDFKYQERNYGDIPSGKYSGV